MIKIPNKEQWEGNKTRSDFPLLPHDEYELGITGTEEKLQEKYQSHDMEEVVNITFEVKGLKGSTEEPKDVNGNTAVGRKIWFTARPDSIGFQQDGTPAKTRCLIYYANDITDLNQEFEFDNWEDLIGQTIYAEISTKKNMKGKDVNFISRFVLPPRK